MKIEQPKFIAYLRTSTTEQEAGLEAQRLAIRNYVQSQRGIILQEFEERMTGTNKKKRIEVYKAVAAAIAAKATLIVQKIDRIGRDMDFWREVKRSGVSFLAMDNPSNSDLISNILMSVSEAEHLTIKSRQKQAYQILKSQGETFGDIERMKNPELRKKALEASIATRKELAQLKNAQALPLICDYVNSLHKPEGENEFRKLTWLEIAKKLNKAGIRTSRGNDFQANTVKQLYLAHCPQKAA